MFMQFEQFINCEMTTVFNYDTNLGSDRKLLFKSNEEQIRSNLHFFFFFC